MQRVAVEQEQYDELWAKAQMARRPDIDLEHWVVAAVKQPESSCSPTLATLIRSGSTFTPVFNQGVCPLIPSETMYLFAIDRSLVTPGFTLEFEGTRTDVEVPAVTPFPSTPKPATPDGALGVVPLPRPGANRSALLDDGMPVWVVDHGDGTVSVLPAVAPAHVASPTGSPGIGSSDAVTTTQSPRRSPVRPVRSRVRSLRSRP